MINANRYLKRRRGKDRSGERWYLQLPVPKDLRHHFGCTIERALNTSDPRVARIRRDAILPDVRAMFDRARAEPTLDEVIPAARRAELARAHAEWSELIADRGVANAREVLGVLLGEEYISDDVECVATPSEAWQRRARRVLLHHGLAPTDEAIERIAETLLEAHIEGAELALEGRAPLNLPAKPAAAPPAPSDGHVTFDDMLSGWKREARPTGRTVLDFTRAMRRLKELAGHDDGARLSREDITRFRDAMLDRGSAKTAFNAMAAVHAVLNVAVRNRKLASNPAAGVTVKVKPAPGDRRLPFDDAEAALILTAARGQRGGRRWVPWLLACTGARLEEVCQAHVADIRQEGGIWYLDINADGHGKALKNAGSARKIPLHPGLIDEGFLEYIRSLQSGPLFPDLRPDCFGRRGGTATKVLGRALRKLGIKDRRKVAGHSWRHRFKDLCRGAGVEKAVHDALTGHASRDVSDDYGLGYPLHVLAAAIEKLPLPLDPAGASARPPVPFAAE
jgi:integrase